MNEQLLLANIRNVLIRLEETIIFALIERAQFKQNLIIYDRDAFPDETDGKGIMGFLLHETEQVHAKMRRYTSPDEHPFFKDLPAPVLPTLRYDENPLHPNEVNLNDLIRTVYETEIIPSLCAAGDDQQYGSSAVCDVACLQAMSKRIHYGKFVAESKYELAPERFRDLLQSRNVEAIHDAITDAAVEAQVLQRVDRKVRTYCGEIAAAGTDPQVAPGQVVDTYRRWIIPLTKQVEVEYLLNRQS